MADYIYNPAESIKQSFQQTQTGIGNIFTQIIAQQQRDYNLAENAFQNIEALKKDVNIFGQKNITAKSNELLKKAGSAILQDGKLDYSKLGEIRQSISEIKDLKAGYDVGAKEYERMLQLGIANKDNLVSFEKFYKELSAKMSDENLVKNPQDLQKAMAETYSDNLDDNKMFIKSFSSANPYEKVVKDIKDLKTGALMRVEGQVPKGWIVGADGKVIPKAPVTTVINGQTVTMDYADQELARLQASDPDLLATMRKKAGFAGSNMSDKDIVKFYIDNKVVAPVSAIQVKSADDLKREAAQAKAADITAKYAEQSTKAQLEGQRLSNIGRALANTGQELENKTRKLALDELNMGASAQESANEIYFSSPKSLVLPVKDAKGVKDVSAKSQKITIDPSTGTIYASVLRGKDNALVVSDNFSGETTITQEPIPKNKLKSFKQTLLASALAGIEKDQKPLVKNKINRMFDVAERVSLSDNLLPKLSPANQASNSTVNLSRIREAVLNNQVKDFTTVDEGVQYFINKGVKVIRN